MTTAAAAPLKLIGGTLYRSFRIVWLLEELGVEYDHVVVHPRSKEAMQHHPLGKVPVLVDGDDVTLWESGAIVTYLGDKYQKSIPPTPRPRYEQIMYTICTELDAQSLWIHRKHHSLAKVFGEAPTAVAEARRTFECTNKALVKQLSHQHLLGEDFGVVDVMWVHTLDWAATIGWSDNWAEEDDKEKLNAYLERCRSRPAYQRTVAKRQAEKDEERKRKEKASKI